MTLTKDNFIRYAMNNYSNIQAFTLDDFEEDIKRFMYLNRLFCRYHKDKDKLRERLILNHLIIIFNSFGIEPALKLSMFKIDEEYYPVLKTFLLYLKYCKEDFMVDIPLDQHVVQVLRKL